MIPKNRYQLGEVSIEHRGNITNTSVGAPSFDNIYQNIENILTYKVGYIPASVEHRPDLISNIFYDTPSYWWLIMLVNNITDPFEQLNANDRILIPVI